MKTDRIVIFWSALVLFVTALSGCQTRQLVLPPNGAACLPYPHAKQPPVSMLHLPVSISLTAVDRLIDKGVPQTLFEQEQMEIIKTVTGKLRVEKNGLPHLRVKGRDLIFELPLKANLNLTWELKTFLGSIKKSQPLSAELTLAMRQKIAFTPDWKIDFEPNIGYEWDQKPTLSILGFEIGLAWIAERELNKQLPLVKKQLQTELSRAFDIRQLVTPVWESLSQPLLLKKKARNSG